MGAAGHWRERNMDARDQLARFEHRVTVGRFAR